MAEEKNQYSIGKVSTLCNVPVRTLRYYDKIGLLVPSHRKDDNHYRYYSQEQLLTLFIIRKLKLLGIPLKEVREIVCGQDTAAMTRSIQARLEEIGQTIETLNGQYEEGQTLLNRLARGQTVLSAGRESWSTEEIQVEDIPACEVLFTRRIKKNYKNSDVSVDRWFELFKMVSKHNLRVKGPVILTYHNKPLEQFFKVDCDLEISIEVNEHQDLPIFKQFGGFRAVTALHIGRNEEIIQSHVKTIKWLSEHGYEVAGPISEEYIVSTVDVNKEEEHITKIIIPVQETERREEKQGKKRPPQRPMEENAI